GQVEEARRQVITELEEKNVFKSFSTSTEASLLCFLQKLRTRKRYSVQRLASASEGGEDATLGLSARKIAGQKKRVAIETNVFQGFLNDGRNVLDAFLAEIEKVTMMFATILFIGHRPYGFRPCCVQVRMQF
ncbi:hypothetical protein M758_4G206000, partial [Ceratodon purpureus]